MTIRSKRAGVSATAITAALNGNTLTLAPPANASALVESGYSLTGSSATSMANFAGTLSTTGVVDVIKASITDTAHGAGSNFINLLGGASGTTTVFQVGVGGEVTTATLNGATAGFGSINVAGNAAGGGNPNQVIGAAGVKLRANLPVAWTNDPTNAAGSLDTGISRIGAAVIGAGNGTAASLTGQFYGATLRTGQTTVAGLPAAATAGAGARSFVTDATVATFGSAATGGGANAVPVWSNGAGWFIG